MKSIASSRLATVYASVPLLVIAVLSARCGDDPHRPAPRLQQAVGPRALTGQPKNGSTLPVPPPCPCNAVFERARILRSIDERRARVRPCGAIHRCDGGAGEVACRPYRRDRPAAGRADQETPTGLR